jgi:hypothetical protein
MSELEKVEGRTWRTVARMKFCGQSCITCSARCQKSVPLLVRVLTSFLPITPGRRMQQRKAKEPSLQSNLPDCGRLRSVLLSLTSARKSAPRQRRRQLFHAIWHVFHAVDDNVDAATRAMREPSGRVDSAHSGMRCRFRWGWTLTRSIAGAPPKTDPTAASAAWRQTADSLGNECCSDHDHHGVENAGPRAPQCQHGLIASPSCQRIFQPGPTLSFHPSRAHSNPALLASTPLPRLAHLRRISLSRPFLRT